MYANVLEYTVRKRSKSLDFCDSWMAPNISFSMNTRLTMSSIQV